MVVSNGVTVVGIVVLTNESMGVLPDLETIQEFLCGVVDFRVLDGPSVEERPCLMNDVLGCGRSDGGVACTKHGLVASLVVEVGELVDGEFDVGVPLVVGIVVVRHNLLGVSEVLVCSVVGGVAAVHFLVPDGPLVELQEPDIEGSPKIDTAIVVDVDDGVILNGFEFVVETEFRIVLNGLECVVVSEPSESRNERVLDEAFLFQAVVWFQFSVTVGED